MKKSIQFLAPVTFLLAYMFSAATMAQVKVVVIPMGGDEPPEVRADSEIYTNSIGMRFSLIPAGSFVMGSPNGNGTTTYPPVRAEEVGRFSNERQYVVTLSKDFYLQTTEVTQAQYQQVMGVNPAYFSLSGDGTDCGLDCPVETVSWNDVQNFIDALNASENRSNCNTQPNTCYFLPTESQWEYAARGATVTATYNGEIIDSNYDPVLDPIAWYGSIGGNSGGKPHPVAQKTPNHWGLYDMLGNVHEWTQDYYGNYPSSPQTDPTGAITSVWRMYRGGSYFDKSGKVRAAKRTWNSPTYGSRQVGFRVAVSPD